MASSKIKGITVEIGGDTTKLGKAIADAEKNSKSLQGELRQVEKLLQFDPGNTELLAQKQRILTQAVEETTSKLKTLRQAEAQVIEQFNRGDIGEDQLRAFQREIVKTEKELDDFEGQLGGTKKGLKDVGNSAEESSGGFTVMKGALADLVSNAITGAISKIGEFLGSLLELSEATEEYRTMQAKLEGSANTFGYSVDFANSKYQEFYKYLGDDQMATNAITNLMGLGTSTENISKIADGTVGVWATYGDSIPIESLTEATNETIRVGKVTGTFADTINWCKDAQSQLGKALDGNKKAQGAFNDALKEGLPVEDAFNEALAKITDEQERADVVAQFLNSTYGESKTTYDELNKSVLDANDAELKLKDTQAQLGETMAPVNNAITDLKNRALMAITPLVEKLADGFMKLYDWLQKNPTAMKVITAVAIALATAFTVLAGALAIQGIISGVTKAIAFLNTTLLANPIVLIIALIAGLVAGFIYLWNNCDAFRNFWINLWENIKTVASNVKDALVEFFTVTIPNAWNNFKTFCSNFINNIVTYFKALPGKIWSAIVSAYERITTWGNNLKTRAVNAVTSLVSSVVNWFKQLPGKIWSAIVSAVTRIATWGNNLKNTAVNAVKNLVSNVFSSASQLPGKIYSAISGAISRVRSWGTNMLNTAKSAMGQVADGIVNKLKSIPSKMLSIGKDIVRGLWNGIKSMGGWIKDLVSDFVSSLVDSAKSFLGIASPSKVFKNEVGRFISEGIGAGIIENADNPLNAVKSVSEELTSGLDELNGATLNRKLATTFNAGTIPGVDNHSLLNELKNIYDRLGRMQIVLDTGTLVGETIDKIDASLASNQMLRARGV